MNNIILIIAQVLGVIILIVDIYGMTKLTTEKVYLFNALGNGLAVIQYLLLGAWTGALCCLIAVLRNIVFSKYKDKVPLSFLLIYILIVILFNFSLIHSWVDLIPLINIIIYAIALWTKNIINIKVVGFATCIDGVIYDYSKRAYVTIIKELLDGIIAIRCIYLLIKDNKKKRTK